ncbi:hypothetical protein B0T11DRAFT_352489 [Plectosphaerella cucumerina]|uniref:Uncharacterized protein n=1 Tax=Plectosphaerella cucumerina TaxID=40658 RepID=A0A8K0X4N3_9PEZI|nr:hypothetical protein B0T11DRAFT_352489 [Plectosphaerella cucumerina]
MTKPPRGPSLAQARDLMSNKHSHFHQHRNRSPNPGDQQHQKHQHQHRHPETEPENQHQERQVPGAEDVPGIVDSPHITRVIQTISIVQIIDGAGNPVEVQTHFAEPATFVVDADSGVTLSAPSLGAAGVAPTSEPDTGSIPSYDAETVSPSPAPAPTPEYSNIPGDIAESTSLLPVPESSELPVQSLDDISTSAPYVPPAAAEPSTYPTISAALNSTLPSSFHSPPNNSSSVRLFAVPESSSSAAATTTTTSYSSISNRRSSSLFTTTTTFFSSSTTASSAESTIQPSAVVGDAGGGNGQGDSAAAPTAASENANDDSTPETGVIVGSVFGSIAGLALVAVLVLLALRWKKRNGGRIALGEDTSRGTRALPAAGAPDDAANAGMTQRSMPWGAGALAGIAAKRASRNAPPPPPSPPAESGERGFYRVSGRKLPSVLASGGDGYTDPSENPFGNQNRSSAMSGDSVLYRDSQGFFDEPVPNDALGRLAVGSPMRPVSGVPIMRSGPAKTPVTESNPFADPAPPALQPPPPSRDAIGRSLGSQDGSRGSGSRFTEEIR